MKVILRSDVRDLGRSGDMVEVKPGYARNFLLPRSLAVPATDGNMRDFHKRISAAKEREARERANAVTLGQELGGQRFVVIHKAAEGTTRLHGSVTTLDIVNAIKSATGKDVDRRDVDIRHPIRSLGEYQVNLKLMRGMSVPLRILVAETMPVEEPPATEAVEAAAAA